MLKGFINRLCGFTGDKYVHFIACMVISLVVANVLPFGNIYGAVSGVLVAIAAGLVKERFDDHVDGKDIKADIIGAVVGGLLSLI